MLFPKKVKFRKWHRGRENPKKIKIATRGNTLSYGSFGLVAEGSAEVKTNQLEAARKAVSHFIQKGGKMWIRIFADKPITAKAAEVPMGKGKGDPTGFVCQVRRGTIILEMDGLDYEKSYEALKKGGSKLPVKTRVISRN